MNQNTSDCLQNKIDDLELDVKDLQEVMVNYRDEVIDLREKLKIALTAIETIKNFNLSKLKRMQIDAYLKKIDEV